MSHHILDALSTSVFLLDEDMMIQYVNEAAETMVQESSNRLFDRSLFDFIAHADSAFDSTNGKNILLEACKKSLHEGTSIWLHDIEISLPPPLKKKRVDCHVATIQTEAGISLVVEVITTDPVHIRYAKLNKMNSSQTLIRGLAHEIRNPLGGVRGAAQLLSNELDSDELIQYTDIIIREADRLSKLVGQMQASVSLNNNQSVNVHSILEHVRKLVESQSSDGLSIQTDYDPSLPEVLGDPDQLTQSFLNIVQNALDAVKSQGQKERIVLKSRIDHQVLVDYDHQQQVVRVDVIDNGDGVDDQLINHIFEPMVTTKPYGTGLGLSITKEIIQNHGGLINFESEAGETMVSVYLKLADREIASRKHE